MAVPGLQPHVEFQETPEPRLINTKTGGALPLTAAESQLLRSWDGSPSATRLSAAVFVKGIDVEPWQVDQFFLRLERLACLTVPRPSIPNLVSPTSGISKLEDKVPRIRGDLLIALAPHARSVFHVADPKSNRAFFLFDTEVSVARMLDGKRKVKDVIDAAGKLGIEVTIDSLQRFISHLKSYLFIDQGVREGESTWPVRQPWTDAERQLYQSSMKNLREGHFAEALSFAESLEATAAKEEARLLKRRVEVESQGVVELVASFGALHSTPQAPVAPVEPPRVVPPSPAQRSVGFVSRHGRLIAGVLVGLGLLSFLVHPVPATTVVACELQVETLGVPRTLRGGKVATRDVAPGVHVEKGAVLARLSAGQPIEGLAEKLKAAEAAVAAVPPPVEGKKTDAARAAVKKLEQEVAGFEWAKHKGNKAQQASGLKRLPGKQRELAAAKLVLDALTHEFTRAPLEAELKSLREAKEALSASIVIAPISGIFVGVGALPDELGVNDSYGQIVGPQFKVVMKEALPAGLSDSAIFRTAGREAKVRIAEGQPFFPVRADLVGAKGTLEVITGSRPWITSVFFR